MKSKKVLIVFSDLHLPYSPTTLNLFYALRKRNFEVVLIAPQPEAHFSLQKLQDPGIRYIEIVKKAKSGMQVIYTKILNNLGSKSNNNQRSLFSDKAEAFIQEIYNSNPETIIAVDFFSLWCVQQTGRSAHLLSLEILESDPYYLACDLNKIDSVIIQSMVRYNYLFKGTSKPDFHIIPNSPAWIDFNPPVEKREKNQLIYCGSAVVEFGIISCLDFISDYSEYKLTIKGAVPQNTKEGIEKFYAHLLKEGRLIINETYIDAVSLTYFVADYRVGFTFYDFYRFPYLRKFNYYTAPSGKLFQYFNSGVPVIGNELDGFEMVRSNNAGKLISSLSSLKIKSALDQIEEKYEEIAGNAKMLSRKYDASNSIENFIDKELSV